MDIYLSINVYGKELETRCDNPKTGFFRNGLCDTCSEDRGQPNDGCLVLVHIYFQNTILYSQFIRHCKTIPQGKAFSIPHIIDPAMQRAFHHI